MWICYASIFYCPSCGITCIIYCIVYFLNNSEALQQRVAALEQERAEFIKLKQQLEAEFNQKRAKFKELYLSKEGMNNHVSLQCRVLYGFLLLHIYLPSIIHYIFDQSRHSSEELKRQNVVLEGAQAELGSIQTQLAHACAEIETIKAVATVSENTKQEAIDQVRSQWQEEVASLQAIMKGKLTCSYKHCAVKTSYF